jgi:hypothetical protein
MKQALAVALIFSLFLTVSPTGIQAQGTNFLISAAVSMQDQQYQDQQYDTYFSPDQLDNLLAPVALYPDPLLAQVLLAATFPDQIDEAARNARAYGNGYNIDATDWDVSVKAVAHYPTVLSMMADKMDWTTSVGQAYANQSTDVMEAVQRLRAQARSMGNLVTSPQQEIVETDGYIYIYPAQPEYIYVPTYDPAIIYVHRGGFYGRPVLFFSMGFLIGAWLNHDCDWRNHRVFYHGWDQGGPRWIDRSRPRVHINNIYVNNNYRNVPVNRDFGNRRVNYGALDRYNSIHPKVDYNNVRRERPGGAPRQQGPAPGQQVPAPAQRDNKIIRRNIDPNDPRIGANRGRDQQPTQQQRGNVQVPRQPEVTQPQPPVTQQRGNVQVPRTGSIADADSATGPAATRQCPSAASA